MGRRADGLEGRRLRADGLEVRGARDEEAGFYLVRGVWQGGVVHEGDPEDDAELELFLRNQYRTLQPDAWGVGRTLGRQ